jgi:hypothetical protein
MHIPLHAHEVSSVLQLARTAQTATRILLGGVLGSTIALLTACGGPTEPDSVLDIPANLYSAILVSPTSDCGPGAPPRFDLLVLPQHVGSSYTVIGLTPNPAPSTVVRDTLTFSVVVPRPAGSITVSADWTFAQERHTFTGTTSFLVALDSVGSCTFVYATTGTNDVGVKDPSSVTLEEDPRPAAQGSAIGDKLARVVQDGTVPVPGWVWGNPGEIPRISAPCVLEKANGVVFTVGYNYTSPIVLPRTAGAKAYFLFYVHENPDVETATLDLITELGQAGGSNSSIVSNTGFWVTKDGSFNSIRLEQAWYDIGDNTYWFYSPKKAFRGQPGKVYFLTLDIWWEPDANNPDWARWYGLVPNGGGGLPGYFCGVP